MPSRNDVNNNAVGDLMSRFATVYRVLGICYKITSP